MFTPPTFAIAMVMMIVSAICWGSWANTYKGVKNYRFELFYWDYAVGIFLISLILAVTMGNRANDTSSFLSNVHSADTSNFWFAMLAGAIFNLANLLLVAGIDMAGLAIAFPVAIGIALVVGVVLTYLREPKGNPVMLGAGVLCAIVAVVMDGKAYGQLPTGNRAVSRKSIVVCVAAFLFHLEYLFYAAAAGGRAGGVRWFFPGAREVAFARIAWRIYLGDWDGF